MRGMLLACLGGAFIALQGMANSRIGAAIGTWQAATLTQLTGFVAALLIASIARGGKLSSLKAVRPMYAGAGALAAIIIFGNVTAMHAVGAAVAIALVMIAQLALTTIVERMGWFGVAKRRLSVPQWLGLGLMLAGVAMLRG